jgi:hypothetical protein
MPNYKSSFLWFPNVAAMSSLLLDSTDEDGLFFAVGVDDTTWKLATWRKSSTATINNTTIFAANGPGRWVILDSTPTAFLWNSGNVADWNSDSATNWNTAA